MPVLYFLAHVQKCIALKLLPTPKASCASAAVARFPAIKRVALSVFFTKGKVQCNGTSMKCIWHEVALLFAVSCWAPCCPETQRTI